MKKILLLLCLGLTFVSCKKEIKQECDINNTGVLQIINSKQNPYYVYIDGVYDCLIQSGETITKTVNSFSYSIKFEDQYAPISNPIIKNVTVYVEKCMSTVAFN